MVVTTSTASALHAASVKLTYGAGNIEDAANLQRGLEIMAVAVGTSGEDGAAMGASAIRSCLAPLLAEPAELPNDASVAQKKRNDNDWETYFENTKHWGKINMYIYNYMLSICDPRMKERLQGQDDFADITAQQDGIRLLTLIRSICHRKEGGSMSVAARVEFDVQVHTACQKEKETLQTYAQRFIQMMEVSDSNGAKIGSHQTAMIYEYLKEYAEKNGVDITSGIEEAVKDKTVFTDTVVEEATKKAREAYRAALLLVLADRRRFSGLKDDLRKKYLLGEDKYPRSIAEAVRLLDQYEKNVSTKSKQPGEADESLAFFQGHEEEKKEDDGAHIEAPTDPAKLAAFIVPLRKGTAKAEAGWKIFKTFDKAKKSSFWAAHNKLQAARTKGEAHVNMKEGEDVTSLDGVGFAEVAGEGHNASDGRALVDSCASHHSAHSDSHLTNVREAKTPLRSQCNAGTTTATQQGDMGPITFFLGSDGIATLLSEPQLEREGCSITKIDGVRKIIFPNGNQLTCKSDSSGVQAGMPWVYASELKALPADAFTPTTSGDESGENHLQTVRGNISGSGLTPRQIKRAYLAADLQAKTGHHTDETFKRMVSSDGFRNSPITVQDISHKQRLFGPSRAALRGRTTRAKPDRVNTEQMSIPRDFYELHKFVTLCGDVMFVNGVAFLCTSSRDIRFFTAEHVPNRTAKQLSSSLKKIIRLYGSGGFIVRIILMDMEFEKVADEMENVIVNTTAAREHVAEIERGIRTIKERARCTVSELPFAWKCLHRQVIIHLIYHTVKWLNVVPAKDGISEKFSPREIVLQRRIDVAKDAPFQFGTYLEASNDDELTNTMKPRTDGGIFLGTSNNIQRSHKVFDLRTGKVVTRRTSKEVPMPNRVIRRMNWWGKKSKQIQYGRKLAFLNRRKQSYDWENDENDPLEALEEAEEQKVHDDVPAELPGIPLEEDIPEGPAVIDEPEETLAEAASRAREAAGIEPDQAANAHSMPTTMRRVTFKDILLKSEGVDIKVEDVDELDEDVDDEEGADTAWENPDDREGDVAEEDLGSINSPPTPSRYPSRQRRQADHMNIKHSSDYDSTKSYSGAAHDGVIHATVAEEVAADFEQEPDLEFILGVALAQTYNLKQGLKLFGKRAEAATTKEFTQLHETESFVPLDAKSLSYEERREALTALLFLTEKRDGKIKARVPVDGSPQRKYVSRQDAASPTVANEAVKLTCAQEAHERRCVKVIDCPGAFLKADLEDHVVMVFRGRLAELMAEVAPKLYRKYIILGKNGEPLLYVKLQKALYGLLQSALLFYKKLAGDLKADGFTLNLYDPCVANKMVNGKQMTVTWHVDDLKISHFEEKEVDKFIGYLKSIYGDNLSEQGGPVVDYLGTHIYYPGDGTVQFSQIPYLSKIIDDFPEQITATKASPAANYLFNVRDEAEATYLDTERANAFHHATAQLAFLRARSRPDIDPAVAFLTTRVRKPDEDDWGKLKRVLQYLKGTKYMKLTISVNSLTILNWWVDASYSIHEDCKGHTGIIMSMGKGATLSASWKQKINVRSSTEGELVGIDDALPLILWCLYFMEAQGYTIEHNIVNQDNQSTLLLARNGRFSSGKRTKHIKARYFNIADKVAAGEIELAYEPTETMWADVLNKPKQGKAFREFRAFLMNVPTNYDDEIERERTHPDQMPRDLVTVDTDTLTKAAQSIMQKV